MLNITAVGRVAFDPEQKQINDELCVTKFKILVNKKIKGEDVVSAISCSVWGNRGNTVMQYINKGDQITVSGGGTIRAYARNNGEPSAEIDLRVDEFTLPARPKKPAELPF